MTDQRVPPTTPEQRRASFSKICKDLPAAMYCTGCGLGATKVVGTLCEECFVAGTPGARALEGKGAEPEPVCGICGRTATVVIGTGQTIHRGMHAAICSTCACAAAGCAGAKNGTEARAMMAQASLQAEAVVQCLAVMKAAGAIKPEAMAADPNTVATLVQAAEGLARIARGDA